MDHRHYADLDTRLEALALYRSVVSRDAEARDAILGGTSCAGCLALGAVELGLTLTIRANPRSVREDLGAMIAGIRREVADQLTDELAYDV